MIPERRGQADSGAEQWSVLLVDDHRIFASVLANQLRSAARIQSVDIATSLDEARANLHRRRPDVVVLDLRLDGETGLDLFADLNQVSDPPRVLMLSATSSPAEIVRALDAGAHGWVTKTARFETLLAAAEQVGRGQIYLEPQTIDPVLRLLLSRRASQEKARNFVDTLTVRQAEVLRCLVGGLSRAESAERLHLSPNTVRTHVQVLMRSADVHTTLALVALARELGVTAIDDPRTVDAIPAMRVT